MEKLFENWREFKKQAGDQAKETYSKSSPEALEAALNKFKQDFIKSFGLPSSR